MHCFQPSHTSFLSPHLFDKFTSMLLVILILHNKHLFFLQKFSPKELVDMPMCNLLEIVDNVWLQQSGKRGACLYVVTFDDYIQAFKQSTLYFHFKQGGWPSQGLDKSELLLCKTTRSRDPKQLVDVVLKYSPRSACTIGITHMEGEEIFGSYKQKVNLALWSEGDSHRHNYVNFSHPHVNHIIVKSRVKLCNLGESNSRRCWSLWSSMWRWSLAYRKMPPYITCSMFHVAKNHQAFLCC